MMKCFSKIMRLLETLFKESKVLLSSAKTVWKNEKFLRLPVWFLRSIWSINFELLAKKTPQYGQAAVLSPEWCRQCTRRLALFLKCILQPEKHQILKLTSLRQCLLQHLSIWKKQNQVMNGQNASYKILPVIHFSNNKSTFLSFSFK